MNIVPKKEKISTGLGFIVFFLDFRSILDFSDNFRVLVEFRVDFFLFLSEFMVQTGFSVDFRVLSQFYIFLPILGLWSGFQPIPRFITDFRVYGRL
jgi:hypothetical protein